jgi:beta-1,4-mannosyl-glycoprotein beta-1,4-N-acetylglucosaminyltransferase|tara:strand:+ start:1610 stop:2413 length:804 start_codon:yes stop_codon:yes gene_type:complete
MKKIFDCVTFFRENFITNIRFEILNEVVDYFVICESRYDHKGNKKELNFKLLNPKFKKKIIYLKLDEPFLNGNNPWVNQAKQREYIHNGLINADDEDYIMFSDPDEIPRPELLHNLIMKKKYAIFMQDTYCYKFNIFNKYESPWEGTRVCKKKNLKSIDYMRQKIKSKNIEEPFWKIFKEKSIQLVKNGGWHFNSLMNAEEISKKLKTFAHTEFANEEYSHISTIEKNIAQKKDLFKRGHYYEKVELNSTFPTYLIDNEHSLKKWFI